MITAFLTDSSLCIGCKACEVACKEWNDVPGDGYTWRGFSYDQSGSLGHATWRHVKFVESPTPPGASLASPMWEFVSDVCKHCERAGCLDACPTGSIVRTEFGGVYVQPDVCNGCGYCVVTCPFGVIDRRPDDGRAFKCTFCYDRQKARLIPACAKACPTESILFGEIEELRVRGAARVVELRARGVAGAQLYDARDTSVAGTHALFIVRQDPRAANLPSRPEAPASRLAAGWGSAAVAACFMIATVAIAFLGASDD